VRCVRAAAAAAGQALAAVHLFLIDCATPVRHQRLRGGRAQPELASAEMDGWARYLRWQARASGVPIVDTTRLSPDDAAEAVMAAVGWIRTAPLSPA
jgi:hypothetical protein